LFQIFIDFCQLILVYSKKITCAIPIYCLAQYTLRFVISPSLFHILGDLAEPVKLTTERFHHFLAYIYEIYKDYHKGGFDDMQQPLGDYVRLVISVDNLRKKPLS
jgi:hypothetical protein